MLSFHPSLTKCLPKARCGPYQKPKYDKLLHDDANAVLLAVAEQSCETTSYNCAANPPQDGYTECVDDLNYGEAHCCALYPMRPPENASGRVDPCIALHQCCCSVVIVVWECPQ